MNTRTTGLAVIFALLLLVSTGGILYHYATGYDYPASPASTFELNVLNDPYELVFLVPAGLIGLWALRRGSTWGPLIVAGVALTFAYNYALLSMGQQNLWIFLWTAKIALSGTAVCLAWSHLPKGPGRRTWQGSALAAYLGLSVVLFSAMMAQRLLGSATGRTVDMAMQGAGALDWGEPFLRDPIFFFTMICPVQLAAVIGLLRGTEWGARAAALSSTFGPFMVSAILFTGPLKEYLQKGAVSPAMWQMSAIMVLLAAIPSVLGLLWLANGDRSQTPTHRA
jgi:hypothetical protein